MIDTASNIGTANRNIIIEPCSVNSWLNVPALTRSLSGTASCVRMMSASTPANSMKAKAVSTYQTPTRLLLQSVQRRNRPLGGFHTARSRSSCAARSAGSS